MTVAERCIQAVFKIFFQFRGLVVFTLLLPSFFGSATISFAQTQEAVQTNVIADTSQDFSVNKTANESSSSSAMDSSGSGTIGTPVKESARITGEGDVDLTSDGIIDEIRDYNRDLTPEEEQFIRTDTAPAASEPTIDIWYGSSQDFGQLGMPQRQIEILGNVSDSDGIASLTYSLNGGPERLLSFIPDNRRLDEPGDFVVDIFDTDLDQGTNTVVITATDTSSNTTTETVTVHYNRANVWPLPYNLDWSSATSILDVAQVVDGKWSLGTDGVRTQQLGYDRLIAIGDMSWTDFEVTVPITIHGIEPPGPLSYAPALGLIIRGTGHSDEPVSLPQPKTGWEPFGAMPWYRWLETAGGDRLQIWAKGDTLLADDSSGKKLEVGETYYFKVRAEGINYKFKVWKVGDPEPQAWDLEGDGYADDPQYGSITLLAHHVDATFGDVTVVSLADPPAASTIVSDDFNYCSLDTDVWALVDPVGDTSMSFTGTYTPDASLNFSLPSASEHDTSPGDNNAPRIMQLANNTDFEVSAKFLSGVSQQYSMQGILVEEDADNFLGFEFYSDGTDTLMNMTTYSGTREITQRNAVIAAGDDPSPLYLALKRVGIRWIGAYSLDGASWTPFASFISEINMSQVGVYAANAEGGSSPAHSEVVDYFLNNSSIGGEDDDPALTFLTINADGNGSVVANPASGYTCNDIVTLTAAADVGWTFYEWSGDLSGSTSPDSITLDGNKVITSTFNQDEYTLMVNKQGSGTVTVNPNKNTYHYGEQVSLTAASDPDWKFTGWSGDLSGSDNPATLTLSKNSTVTATFILANLTLMVNEVGGGKVMVFPDKSTFSYGDQVTLFATADPGWKFSGWSGAVSSSNNPAALTITSNTTVTATFTQDEYALTVNKVGNGTVTVDPIKSVYYYGDQAGLTGTPDPGWIFIGWSGDISGGPYPATLTITSDTSVTATFLATDDMRIFLPLVGNID